MRVHGVQIYELLAEAIFDLHQLGYSHLNIFPENILVSQSFKKVQLIGLNNAAIIGLPVFGRNDPSPPYWNDSHPEWQESSTSYDLLALGVIGFEMLANDYMFQGTRDSGYLWKGFAQSIHYHQFTKFADVL
jgi:serine/threonine protein kinase